MPVAEGKSSVTGASIFGLPEYRPHAAQFHSRLNRLIKHRRYADGTIYADSAFKLAHKLYAQTTALFNILSRAVDLDIALVPGVMQPWELEKKTPAALVEAQSLLYEWSGWDVGADDWLEDGTETGEALLKIVPDVERGVVKILRLKPEHGQIVRHAQDGEVVDLLLVVDRAMRDEQGVSFEYAEAITPLEIRTYRNGEPHGYGGNPDRYPNPLGFVPAVPVKNDSECRPTFGKVMAQIDRVNEMASYLGDIIGRHAEPVWAAFGASKVEEAEKGGSVWYMPKEAKLQAILAEIDVPGTLSFVESVKSEAKSALPELSFDDLRTKEQIATETLEVQLIELDAKIWRMRRRYDATLVDAHRMAAAAAVAVGVDGLAPLLAPHSFDYKRPVRPVSELDAIRLEEARLSLAMQQAAFGSEGIAAGAPPKSSAALEPEANEIDNEESNA